MSENTNTPADVAPVAAQAFTEPTREERVIAARGLIHRFLGNPTGQAEDMARGLTDDELDALIAAGVDRQTAVTAIKDVFTAAYERKRKEHEAGVHVDLNRLQKRSKASRVLSSIGMPTKSIQEALQHLSEGEQTILAELDGETDIGEVVEAILRRASDRAVACEFDVVEATGDVATTALEVSTADGTLEPGWDEPAAEAPAIEPVAEVTATPEVVESPSEPAAEEPAVEPVAEAAPPPAAPPKPIAPKPAKKK